MAKRHVQKKKQKNRSGCFVGMALLLLAALALVAGRLALSTCRGKTKPEQPADALWDGGWYQDDLGRIEEDKALIKGMEAFEKRTGVKPYLTILDGVDPEELSVFVQDQYDALFADGGHLLVVYDEWEEDGYYLVARAGGTASLSVENVEKILTCLETAYADPANETYAEAFGAGFREAAKALPSAAGSGVGLLVAGLLLLLLSMGLVLFLRRRAREAARREADVEAYLEDDG